MTHIKILLILLLCSLTVTAQKAQKAQKISKTKIAAANNNHTTMSTAKMKVDIWSDIMCPFCYIGKRHFEAALEQFPQKDKVEIIWHSFQLDPDMKTDTSTDVYTYLAERKGISKEQSKAMHVNVINMAKQAGLHYDFDKAVIANSFDAHRLIQLAKTHKLGDAAEERLFKAYFTEGANVADHKQLIQLGTEIGLDATEVQQALAGDAFSNDVHIDIMAAQNIGVRGVPFFVLNDQYAVSGAQPSDAFLGALKQAWESYEKTQPKLTDLTGSDAAVCEPGKDCAPASNN